MTNAYLQYDESIARLTLYSFSNIMNYLSSLNSILNYNLQVDYNIYNINTYIGMASTHLTILYYNIIYGASAYQSKCALNISIECFRVFIFMYYDVRINSHE